jgi:hypothetical protein
VGNLPSWEELELQADRVADEIFSGVESSLMSISDMDLDELPPEQSAREETKEEEATVGRLRQVSRGEWLLLGTALSSVTLAGSLWWTQMNPTMPAKAQEAPTTQPSSLQSMAVVPSPTNTATTTQEEKILQRYKQDLQATKTALGTKAGNKANPFFPSVKAKAASTVVALPPGSQQPFQVARVQTPTVQFTQPVAQAPQAAQTPPFKVQAQPVAASPQRYNIPPLPRILPAPPSLRPLRAKGALPPAPPPIQMQTATPSPSPLNVQTAAQNVENTQAPTNSSSQVKPQPQTLASAAPTHSLVGIMGTGSKRQTALIKNGESVREVLPGEQIGGGWTLQSIAENQVTLRQGGQTKVLTLGDP